MTIARSERTARRAQPRWVGAILAGAIGVGLTACSGGGAPETGGEHIGGEANLQLPDLGSVSFLGLPGDVLLGLGLVVCALGLGFGLMTYTQLRKMPAHAAMKEISELIYTTCKAYLKQQGRFLMILWAFIAAIIIVYYLAFAGFTVGKTAIVIAFSLIGMAGSYAVAWYGIRVNTLANSRTAHAALGGKPYPAHDIPLRSGMSIGMVLISVELAMMLIILVFLPGEIAGACFIGFAIGESLGASALRIAGGIFTKIADIGADLMKIVFKIKEDDARNPGVIADCTGDNAGDSVGPTADGFETYGVTGVALISFIMLAVKDPVIQVQLLVWIFMMRVMMVLASAGSYLVNNAIEHAEGDRRLADRQERSKNEDLGEPGHQAGQHGVDVLVAGRHAERCQPPADVRRGHHRAARGGAGRLVRPHRPVRGPRSHHRWAVPAGVAGRAGAADGVRGRGGFLRSAGGCRERYCRGRGAG